MSTSLISFVALVAVAPSAHAQSDFWGNIFGVAKTLLMNTGGTTTPTDPEPAATQAPLMSGLGDLFSSFFNSGTSGATDPSSGWLNNIFGGTSTSTTTPTTPDDSANTGTVNTGGSTKTGVGSACKGISGTCYDRTASTCAKTYITGKCPGPTEVVCCPSGTTTSTTTSTTNTNTGTVSSGSGSCSQYGGLYFPLASGSLSEISVNWGGSRDSGKRCHAGVDIYTTGARKVQAVAAGRVTNIMKNWYTCSGKSIDAIFVYHSSGPLAGKTINYGEVNPGTYSVTVGSSVSAGQQLATAVNCGMLHFELYNGDRKTNLYWKPASGNVGSGCVGNSLQTKPADMLDPRPLLRCTMPSNARFRNGVGFLNNDQSTFEKDLAEEGEETPQLSVGGIVAIVVVFVAVCVGVLALVVCIVVRRRRASGAGVAMSANETGMRTTTVSNAVYSANAPAVPADFGHFKCPSCDKEYSYANDLEQHRVLRHGL